ncbi:MAG: glycosyltransferase family 2 protein [Saprospiraceae bacterium]
MKEHKILPVSAVITTFNSARTLESVMIALNDWVNQIVIVDSGSTDSTLEIAKKFNCNIISEAWHGYGANKNVGLSAAANDWILSIDSDEEVSESLKAYFSFNWNPNEIKKVYRILTISYLGERPILHGGWGKVYNYRLFRKSEAKWDLSAIHEELIFDRSKINIIKLNNPIHHYTTESVLQYRIKLSKYAKATALKYFNQNRKTSFFLPWLSALFLFIKEYILKSGFLDGWVGFQIAFARSISNFEKYRYLRILNRMKNK